MKRSADDMTYYIQAKEGRDIAMRSLQAQGFKINKKDLRSNPNAAGTRGRFNVFNNNQSSFYATGSWKSGTGLKNSGPRASSKSNKWGGRFFFYFFYCIKNRPRSFYFLLFAKVYINNGSSPPFIKCYRCLQCVWHH